MNGQGQDKKVNWNDIPDSTLIPAGKILFQISEIEETVSGSGKLMYKHKLTAVEPAEVNGMVHFENFVIGSDDDPLADSPMTWKSSIGAKRMKNMYTKARVPFSESMYATMAAAKGALFVGKTVIKKDSDPNSKYFGNEQTNITTCYMVGETVPALEGSGNVGIGVGVGVGVGAMPVMPALPATISPAVPGALNAPEALAKPPTTIPAAMPTAPVVPPILATPPATPPPAPIKQMTAKAQGTYEAYQKAGWSDAQLIEHGFMELVNPAPAMPAMFAMMPAVPAVSTAPGMPAPTLAPNVGAPTPTSAPAPVVASTAPPAMSATMPAVPPGEACTSCPMCQAAIPNSQFAGHVAMCAANRAAQAAGGLK